MTLIYEKLQFQIYIIYFYQIEESNKINKLIVLKNKINEEVFIRLKRD